MYAALPVGAVAKYQPFMNWDADIDLSQQQIQSRIDQIKNDLPPDVNISVEKMNPSILPVSGYTLESHSKSPIELKQLATYTVKPFLSQVDGVSEIRVIGGKTKEYWLVLNTQKMGSLGLTPDIITNTLAQTGFIKSEGYLSDYKMLYLTVTDASVNTSQQLENLVISNNRKRVIQLKGYRQHPDQSRHRVYQGKRQWTRGCPDSGDQTAQCQFGRPVRRYDPKGGRLCKRSSLPA
jgi:Cu/Ag efflux pump CusA